MYHNAQTLVFLDGKCTSPLNATASLYNQTMHYGNGVFEGIRSYNTEDGVRIFKAREHFERLHFSASKMHITIPYSVEELENYCYELLGRNQLSDAYIRPLVFMGDNMNLLSGPEVHVAMMAWRWEKYLGDKMLRVMLSSYQRPNPKSCYVEAKVCGHYTNSILASIEAKQNGYDEALLTDANGFIAEAPGANFFFEKDGELFTAPSGNILPGITRATIMELAAELNIPVEEKLFTPGEILAADAAFFCGTAVEVTGIESFNRHVFPLKWEDSASYYLQRKYKKHVASNEYRELYL